MEQVLLFFTYSLIVFLLAALLGGTMIGYYFTKKKEFELGKIKALTMLAKQANNEQN